MAKCLHLVALRRFQHLAVLASRALRPQPWAVPQRQQHVRPKAQLPHRVHLRFAVGARQEVGQGWYAWSDRRRLADQRDLHLRNRQAVDVGTSGSLLNAAGASQTPNLVKPTWRKTRRHRGRSAVLRSERLQAGHRAGSYMATGDQHADGTRHGKPRFRDLPRVQDLRDQGSPVPRRRVQYNEHAAFQQPFGHQCFRT